jgi:hypothetical protein
MTGDTALHALFDRMCRAWTDGDAQEYGECFTADSDTCPSTALAPWAVPRWSRRTTSSSAGC